MQLRSSQQARRLILLLLFNLILNSTFALKCRSEDGPSDAELKRVARTCMHKISENSYSSKRSNSGGTSGSGQMTGGVNSNSYYGQQHDQQYDQHGQSTNRQNYYGYDDDNEQREENKGNNYRGNNNNNFNNYERVYSNDMLRQRNRERSQNSHSARSQRSASVLFNFERVTNGNGRYDQSSNDHGRNSNSAGNSSGAGSNNGGSSSRDHRASASSTNNYSNSYNNNYNSSHDRDRQSQESACIIHCFFEEMNMLNKDDYPDKHKVSYLLTKDMRDRELRSFYIETIQECFHYLDSQRRRDKCHFSRDLIHCMTAYAKANCADWDDYNIMFN